MRTLLAILLVWAATALVLSISGCGSARRGEPFTRPLNITDPDIAQGQLVFMNHCNQCHPGGAAGLAPALNDKPLPAGLIKFQVRNGLGAMPAFDEKVIPDDQLDDLTTYLKSLRRLDRTASR